MYDWVKGTIHHILCEQDVEGVPIRIGMMMMVVEMTNMVDKVFEDESYED